jgi:hypothetical protein
VASGQPIHWRSALIVAGSAARRQRCRLGEQVVPSENFDGADLTALMGWLRPGRRPRCVIGLAFGFYGALLVTRAHGSRAAGAAHAWRSIRGPVARCIAPASPLLGR